MHDAYYCLKHYNDLLKEHNINSCWVANWSKELDCVDCMYIILSCKIHLKCTSKLKLFKAAPVDDWVRSQNYSAHNHSIISPLCLVKV